MLRGWMESRSRALSRVSIPSAGRCEYVQVCSAAQLDERDEKTFISQGVEKSGTNGRNQDLGMRTRLAICRPPSSLLRDGRMADGGMGVDCGSEGVVGYERADRGPSCSEKEQPKTHSPLAKWKIIKALSQSNHFGRPPLISLSPSLPPYHHHHHPPPTHSLPHSQRLVANTLAHTVTQALNQEPQRRSSSLTHPIQDQRLLAHLQGKVDTKVVVESLCIFHCFPSLAYPSSQATPTDSPHVQGDDARKGDLPRW